LDFIIEDQLLLTLYYLRNYHTFLQLGTEYNSKFPDAYQRFIKSVDITIELRKEYSKDESKNITDFNKYRCVDILCQEIYYDSDYKDWRDVWNQPNKSLKYH